LRKGEEPDSIKRNGLKRVSNFFKKLSKAELNHRKFLTTKAKKLPKNFANLVLDEELKIDSGNFDISNVNKLMALYSVSTTLLLFKIYYSRRWSIIQV
jgi:hypothetical protein